MLEHSPSCKCIRGPYLFAKFLKEWWRIEPTSWCRFPISGNFHGPGGRFGTEYSVLKFFRILANMNKKIKKVKSTVEGIGRSMDVIRSMEDNTIVLKSF